MEFIKKITDSYYFIAGVNLFIFLCWAFNLFFLAVAVFFLAFLAVLLTQKSANGIIPFFASIIFCVNDTGNGAGEINAPLFWDTLKIILYIYAPLLAAALVFFFVRNKTQIRGGRILPALIVFFIAAAFGGAGTKEYTFSHSLTLLGYGAALIAAYLFFGSAFDFKAESFKKYFAASFFAAALLVAVEVAVSYLRLGYVFTGWGIGNTAGQVQALFLPFAFYLIYLSRKKAALTAYYAAVFLMLGMILLTRSRTAMVAAACAVVPLYILTHKKMDGALKKTNLFMLAAAGAVALAACLVFMNKIPALLESLFGGGDITSGRIGLWKDGLKAFAESPIFGKGFFYKGSVGLTDVEDGFLFMYWYHNTFVQIAVNMGLVGLAALVYFTVKKYQTYLHSGDFFSFFIFIILAAGEIEGLLDIHSVTLAYNIFMLMFIACGERLEENEKRQLRAEEAA